MNDIEVGDRVFIKTTLNLSSNDEFIVVAIDEYFNGVVVEPIGASRFMYKENWVHRHNVVPVSSSLIRRNPSRRGRFDRQ